MDDYSGSLDYYDPNKPRPAQAATPQTMPQDPTKAFETQPYGSRNRRQDETQAATGNDPLSSALAAQAANYYQQKSQQASSNSHNIFSMLGGLFG